MNIDKQQLNEYLKNHSYLNGNVKINNDGSLTLTINLGAKVEKKLSKTDLILKELKTINSRLDAIDTRLTVIEREATKNGWDLTPDNKNN